MNRKDSWLMTTFWLINLFLLSLLGVAYLNGWVDLVLERDKTPISLTIVSLHGVGLVLCYLRARRLNKAFKLMAENKSVVLRRYVAIAQVNASNATEGMKVMLGRKLIWIKTIITILPTLGLLGTVVGIAMALEGSQATDGADIADLVKEQYGTMTTGLSVAFYTTIVGVVFMLWQFVNIKLLENRSMRLMERVLEESHVGILKSEGCSLEDCNTAQALGTPSDEDAMSDDVVSNEANPSVDSSADETEVKGDEQSPDGS